MGGRRHYYCCGGLVVRGKEDRVAGDVELEPWVDCGEKVKEGFLTERFKYIQRLEYHRRPF